MSQQPPPPQQPPASLSAASPSAAPSPSLDLGQPQQQLRQPPPSRSQQCPQPQGSTATHGYSTIASAASLADISLQSGNNNIANRSDGGSDGDSGHAMMMTSATSSPLRHIDVVDIVEQSKLPDTITTATADPVKREETPFSLKHFLRRNPFTTTAAVTSTITTPPTASLSSAAVPVAQTTAAGAATSLPQHRSTGARPKIPSSSATSMYSNPTSADTASPAVPTSASSYDTSSAGTARMKRSPKFSSFDSQASLAEFSTSTSSPSCTSLPANVATSTGATNLSATAAASSGGGVHFGTGGSYRQLSGSTSHYTSASGASGSALLGDSEHDHVIVSPSSPSGGGGVAFQRSFSTYDIGGGGRRYNVGGGASRHRAGDAFARATSMQGHQIIHDDDANDDDDDEDGLGAGCTFIDSPTRRALRASAAAGILSPDISAALPDFVQDHILVEHLYGANGSGGGSGPMGGREATESGRDERRYRRHSRPQQQQQQQHQQLPDFTQNATAGGGSLASSLARGTTEQPSGSSAASRSHGSATGNMPFDLMCSPGGGCEAASAAAAAATQQRRRLPPNLPLDLPAVGIMGWGRQRTAIYHDIPLDLTARNDLGVMNGNGDIGGVGVEYVDLVEPGAVRTLPDFLADGHVHANAAANGNGGCNSGAVGAGAASSSEAAGASSGAAAGADARFTVVSVDETLRRENTRLRNELAHSQQALLAQQRRSDDLTAAAEQSRQQRHNERSARQRADAELPKDAAVMAALRRQVKDLTDQVEVLRKENAILKEEGAVGGATTSHSTASSPQPIGVTRLIVQSTHELSRDMRLAAATADNNLRQLLSGVDNLRLMASRIESLADLAIVDIDAATTPSSASGDNAAAGHDSDD